MFSPLLLSPPLHHTIPSGTNLRLTVYRRITRLHLSNLGPNLPASPREGAMDQEKGEEGRKEWKREVCLCPKGLVSVCVNQEVRMWQQERHLFTAHVCVCVCMDLVELRCHICEDRGFKLVATRDEALNRWNARDNCAVICCVDVRVSSGTFDGD